MFHCQGYLHIHRPFVYQFFHPNFNIRAAEDLRSILHILTNTERLYPPTQLLDIPRPHRRVAEILLSLRQCIRPHAQIRDPGIVAQDCSLIIESPKSYLVFISPLSPTRGLPPSDFKTGQVTCLSEFIYSPLLGKLSFSTEVRR